MSQAKKVLEFCFLDRVAEAKEWSEKGRRAYEDAGNPMDRVERPQPKKFVGDFYSVDEVKTLLEHAKEDVIYIPIVLAVYCGLRRSEALGLSWSNIDFENDKIFIGQKVLGSSATVRWNRWSATR